MRDAESTHSTNSSAHSSVIVVRSATPQQSEPTSRSSEYNQAELKPKSVQDVIDEGRRMLGVERTPDESMQQVSVEKLFM